MAEKKASAKKPTLNDFEVIIEPVITEKTMSLMQESNKVTLKVNKNANRANIKKAFEKLFGVKAVNVNIARVNSKAKSRGGRYKGFVSGYKKAIVTIESGAALDLFKD